MSSAALVIVGTELAEGVIQDSHTQYLSRFLRRAGYSVVSSVLVPDSEDLMQSALVFSFQNADLIVLTGGLGPTSDDRTREVVAQFAERQLEFRDDVWNDLCLRWAKWHGTDNSPGESNRRQALIPEGFSILENDVGTAPGFLGDVNGKTIVALPGPPSELWHVVETVLEPILHRGASDQQEVRGTAFLVGESSLEDALLAIEYDGDRVEWGTRAAPSRIEFYLRSGSPASREMMFRALQSRLGEFRIRKGTVDPAAGLLQALRESDLSVVTAESCTGGLIASMLTAIPGSSESVWGGVVSYANHAKETLLSVSPSTITNHGAVSKETVEEMVVGAMRVSGCDVGISVSGVAGPGGGTSEKPVGTVWIAVGRKPDAIFSRQFLFAGARDRIRLKSAIVGLLMARDLVEGITDNYDVDLDTYEIS